MLPHFEPIVLNPLTFQKDGVKNGSQEKDSAQAKRSLQRRSHEEASAEKMVNFIEPQLDHLNEGATFS